MGTDLSLQDLFKTRNQIMDEILQDLISWDNTLESGIGLIESNQINLDRIQEINGELYNFSDIVNNDENYFEKLSLIMKEIENLTGKLRNKRTTLIEGKNQLNKKHKIMGSYIFNHNEPVFIDKDVE